MAISFKREREREEKRETRREKAIWETASFADELARKIVCTGEREFGEREADGGGSLPLLF